MKTNEQSERIEERDCWVDSNRSCTSSCAVYERKKSHPCGLIRRFDDILSLLREQQNRSRFGA